MSKSTLRRLSKTMPDDEALEFLSDYFPCVSQLKAENEALREMVKADLLTIREKDKDAYLDALLTGEE